MHNDIIEFMRCYKFDNKQRLQVTIKTSMEYIGKINPQRAQQLQILHRHDDHIDELFQYVNHRYGSFYTQRDGLFSQVYNSVMRQNCMEDMALYVLTEMFGYSQGAKSLFFMQPCIES